MSQPKTMKNIMIGLIMAGVLTATAKGAAADPITPKEVVALTKKALHVLEKKGEAGLEDLKGSDFVFGTIYPTIATYDGMVLFHPKMPHLVGRANILGLKDKNG